MRKLQKEGCIQPPSQRHKVAVQWVPQLELVLEGVSVLVLEVVLAQVLGVVLVPAKEGVLDLVLGVVLALELVGVWVVELVRE